MTTTEHASEAGHWYDSDGTPCYEVASAKGTPRPTTLRDARKIGLVPSVTGIIKCADKPALTNWLVDQGILAALTLPRKEGEAEADWLKRVKLDSKETGKKAAERGTLIHAYVQGHYEGRFPSAEYHPFVKAAVEAVSEWFDGTEATGPWNAELSFAHPMGFGGKIDLSHPIGYVLDFKTKEFGPDDSMKTWDEHHMQLAAYRAGLKMPQARAAICYISVNNPGLARVIEVTELELQRGWACFQALLAYWKAKNSFDPAQIFIKKAA